MKTHAACYQLILFWIIFVDQKKFGRSKCDHLPCFRLPVSKVRERSVYVCSSSRNWNNQLICLCKLRRSNSVYGFSSNSLISTCFRCECLCVTRIINVIAWFKFSRPPTRHHFTPLHSLACMLYFPTSWNEGLLSHT
jgi:hypothetical protein